MQSLSTTESLARSFIDCTLPRSEWNHIAHLQVGLWHCIHFPPTVALNLLRKRIKRYNLAWGVANTTKEGYHETITRFYLHIIYRFLLTVDSSLSIDDLSQALIQVSGDRSLPLQYYSLERLFSERARLEWVEPDIKSL